MSINSRIVTMIAIVGRGKGKSYMDMLNAKGIRYHLQCVGQGTAPSEMMDIFGLGDSAKDIVVSFASSGVVDTYVGEMSKKIDSHSGYGGLLVVLPLAAMNRLAAEIIFRSSENTNENGVTNEMNSNIKYHYLFISVNQGYTDQVMQTAKRAGATGGTVIRARHIGAENLEQFGENDVQEEKEVVMILAPVSISDQIMKDVNQEYGMKTPAQGMVCAFPVEKAMKI